MAVAMAMGSEGSVLLEVEDALSDMISLSADQMLARIGGSYSWCGLAVHTVGMSE